MSESGWIKIHRKMLSWQWYQNSNMVHIMLHLVLTANTEDKPWRDITLHRGQLATTVKELSAKTGISEKSVRTCINRLSESGELGKQTTNKYTILTICNYDIYQLSDSQKKSDWANKGQTKGKQRANNNKNNKNIRKKEYKKERINLSLFSEKTSFSDERESEINFSSFKDTFNQYLESMDSSIARVGHITQQRKDLLNHLLASGFTKEDLLKVIYMAAGSPKLNGRTKKSFIPDFDWIFTERNFVRILEGNFNNVV